jgi:hypothetical protein
MLIQPPGMGQGGVLRNQPGWVGELVWVIMSSLSRNETSGRRRRGRKSKPDLKANRRYRQDDKEKWGRLRE